MQAHQVAVSPCSNPGMSLQDVLEVYSGIGHRFMEAFTSWAKSALDLAGDPARYRGMAAERGIPVYTEKPPAATAADALSVARVAAETGTLCTTAFKKRYAVAYARAKEWLADFVKAVREKRTTRSNIYESYKRMVLYEAIAQSAAEKRIVAPAYETL